MKLRITVEGKAYEVEVDVLDESGSPAPRYAAAEVAPVRSASVAPPPAPAPAPVATNGNGNGNGGERVVKAPIVGTVMSVKVKPGDDVQVNQVLLVMEAMKMETNIASPIAGKIKSVAAKPGDAVKAGQVLVELD